MRLQTAIRSSCGSVITSRVFVTRMHSGWRTSCASPLDNRMTNGAKGWRRTSSRMASAFIKISCTHERAYILAAASWGANPGAQKAPGGSRGTPGRTRARVPCMWAPINESPRSSPAWMVGWFSCPVSPGFHPGLLGQRVTPTRSPRRKPGKPPSGLAVRPGTRGVWKQSRHPLGSQRRREGQPQRCPR